MMQHYGTRFAETSSVCMRQIGGLRKSAARRIIDR
jgi:hypothetical protein